MMSDTPGNSNKTKKTPWLWAWDFLTRPHRSIQKPDDVLRARIAATLTLVFMVFNTLGVFAASNNTGLLILSPLLVVAYILTRTRLVMAGFFLFTISISASGFITLAMGESDSLINVVFSFVPLALVMASALLSNWAVFLLVGLNIAAIFGIPYFFTGETTSSDQGLIAGIVTVIGILLMVISAFKNYSERRRITEIEAANKELTLMRDTLEERVQSRTKELDRRTLQLEGAAFVARQTSAIQDSQILLAEVVDLISDQFGFYHAGVFLIDESGRYAVLQAASSEGGRRMIKRGHKLEISRQGIVGYAAYQKRAKVALDVGEDATYFDNPDLPATRSEVALPLTVRGKVIGVLDIQSTEPNAFGLEDINTLQAMADQVALAIENTRLLAESQTSLKQLQALTAESTYRNWKERLLKQSKGYVYTPLGVVDIKAQPHQTNGEKSETLAIPISLRGREIGRLNLSRRGEGSQWTESENLFANEVATQIALALDNARLLEDFRLRAIREQTVGDITSRLSQTTDIDTLLKLAVQELYQLPGTVEASIFVGDPESSQ